MRKFIKYLTIIILFSFWGIIFFHQDQARQVAQQVKSTVQKELKIDQPCGKPLEYSIGSIDSRFNISQAAITQLSEQAAEVWNKAQGKTLLQYNPNAAFKINLIYDQRQEQANAASQLENNLKNLEASNATLEQKYNSLSSAYKQKIDEYNKDLAKYKNDVEKYNAEVNYWNSQGGASQDEYNKLQKEKSDLEDEYNQLEKERNAVNKLAGQTNAVASQENQAVSNYNNQVETYQSQYGGTQEFEKGVFDGTAINIYEFKAPDDLRLTLTHELGHYLGLNHVQNPQSIMYPMIGYQNMKNIVLTAEDMAALQQICK